jgi:hypothetical protein
MKKVKPLLMLVALVSMFSVTAANASKETSVFRQTEKAVQTATFGHIDAKGLKNLIDAKVTFVLLDARGTTKWNDGRRISGAKTAFHEFSTDELSKLIPNKTDLVITYCGSYECPLGQKLAEKLVQVGYQYVLEYPGGIKEWADVAHYPIEKN